jgi:hypothetical protein
MSDNADSSRLVNSFAEIAPSDFLWGADEIGRAIGRNGRQAFHLLNRGEIESAKKVGGRCVVNRASLLRELGARFAMSTIELPGDAQFVESLTRWRTPLSEKQRVWLRDIAARLRRAA